METPSPIETPAEPAPLAPHRTAEIYIRRGLVIVDIVRHDTNDVERRHIIRYDSIEIEYDKNYDPLKVRIHRGSRVITIRRDEFDAISIHYHY